MKGYEWRSEGGRRAKKREMNEGIEEESEKEGEERGREEEKGKRDRGRVEGCICRKAEKKKGRRE